MRVRPVQLLRPERHHEQPLLGITYTDDDILQFVRNIYAVLLTRGVLGTYVYVCDPVLREHLRRFF